MKTILLTGATGFLGSHLVDGILNKTNYNIIILKRSFSDISKIEKNIDSERITLYNIDVENPENIFKNNKPDTIIHCATNYGRNNTNVYEILETNLMLPIKLLDLAVKYGVDSFINTDSFFNKENLSYSYLLNYSLSKKSLLLWLEYFSSKIKIINLVLEHIYGENDSEDKFVGSMIKNIAINKIHDIALTPGEQKRDFVYIEDVVDAYIAILKYSENHSFKYKKFNIGTGKAVSVKDFINCIKEISNSDTVLKFGALQYREDEIMHSAADNKELYEIGWKPKYSYIDGLTKIITGNKN